jgi:hypothetical protein
MFRYGPTIMGEGGVLSSLIISAFINLWIPTQIWVGKLFLSESRKNDLSADFAISRADDDFHFII